MTNDTDSDLSTAPPRPGRVVGALRPPTTLPLHPHTGAEARVSAATGTWMAKDRMTWKEVRIQHRDIRLMSLIMHQKFLTLDQVHRGCFEGASLQMPRMRLRKLGHFGMIQKRRVYTESRLVYVLGKPGYSFLESRGLGRDLGFLSEVDLRVFEHDKAVTDLRLALESAEVEGWKSERELRRERPGARVPDAVFGLRGIAVALEFENADKGPERYRAIFLNHLEQPVAPVVLYVLREPEKLRTLPQILDSLRMRRLGLRLGRISFVLEKEVLERRLEAVTANLTRGRIKIAELATLMEGA